MSEANVEVAKRAVDAYNERDFGAVDDLVIPEFEVSSPLLDRSGDVRGREGLGTYFAEMSDTWEDLRLIVDRICDLADSIVWLGRIDGRGRGSGVPVDAPLGMVFDFRDGRISRLRTFFDHGEALRAAGLAE